MQRLPARTGKAVQCGTGHFGHACYSRNRNKRNRERACGFVDPGCKLGTDPPLSVRLDTAMNNEAPRPELIYPPELEIWPFPADCPNRILLYELSDKWAILVVAALSHGPTRFNEL